MGYELEREGENSPDNGNEIQGIDDRHQSETCEYISRQENDIQPEGFLVTPQESEGGPESPYRPSPTKEKHCHAVDGHRKDAQNQRYPCDHQDEGEENFKKKPQCGVL